MAYSNLYCRQDSEDLHLYKGNAFWCRTRTIGEERTGIGGRHINKHKRVVQRWEDFSNAVVFSLGIFCYKSMVTFTRRDDFTDRIKLSGKT